VRGGVGPLARFGERRLAARYGWNLTVLQGREPVFSGSLLMLSYPSDAVAFDPGP